MVDTEIESAICQAHSIWVTKDWNLHDLLQTGPTKGQAKTIHLIAWWNLCTMLPCQNLPCTYWFITVVLLACLFIWYSNVLQSTAKFIIASTCKFHILCHNGWKIEGFWCLWIVLSRVLAGVFSECSTFDGCPWPICFFTYGYNVPLGSPGWKTVVTLPKKCLIDHYYLSLWSPLHEFRRTNLETKILHPRL